MIILIKIGNTQIKYQQINQQNLDMIADHTLSNWYERKQCDTYFGENIFLHTTILKIWLELS